MIRKCSCPECVAASVRNLDALAGFVLRLATAGAEARPLLGPGRGDNGARRDRCRRHQGGRSRAETCSPMPI